MSEPFLPEARATVMQRTDEADSSVVSRRWLRDFAALLALPAMWVDQEPDFIATGLLGVLFSVLSLESAYVRFDDPTGGAAIERCLLNDSVPGDPGHSQSTRRF